MTVHPILAALRKHKAGAVLIAMQIAVTLAIVSNAIFIISQRVDHVRWPTGLTEKNFFLVVQQWVNPPDVDSASGLAKLDSMQQADISAIQNLPDVSSVASISGLPLLNWNTDGSISLNPNQQQSMARAILYFGDQDAITTLGLRLIAGRAFTAADITNESAGANHQPSVVIVTKALAEKLFPTGNALGRVFYLNGGSKPATIVGIVDRMQVSTVDEWTSSFTWNSVLVPIRMNANKSLYAVRAKPGRLDLAMKAIPSTLYAVDSMRVLDDQSVRPFSDVRKAAYRADSGMAILMSAVCVILVAITTAGIVGLSSFWVAQRYRQIGIRRALGARKIDILFYFHLENLMISCGGAILGIVLAVGLNILMINQYAMDRMPVIYVLAGVLLMLALGQFAVFVPARRACNVPPLSATRVV